MGGGGALEHMDVGFAWAMEVAAAIQLEEAEARARARASAQAPRAPPEGGAADAAVDQGRGVVIPPAQYMQCLRQEAEARRAREAARGARAARAAQGRAAPGATGACGAPPLKKVVVIGFEVARAR